MGYRRVSLVVAGWSIVACPLKIVSDCGGIVPDRVEIVPDRVEIVPDRVGVVPDRGEIVPDRGEIVPDRGEIVPDRVGVVPYRFDRLAMTTEDFLVGPPALHSDINIYGFYHNLSPECCCPYRIEKTID